MARHFWQAVTCSSCRRRRARMPPPPPRAAASAARRTLRFAPQPCGARECAKLRESCVTARRSADMSVGRYATRGAPSAAHRYPNAVTGSVHPPSPLWVPTESGAPFTAARYLLQNRAAAAAATAAAAVIVPSCTAKLGSVPPRPLHGAILQP